MPGGAERGGHAHKNLHQLIIALSGSFDVILDDGQEKKAFSFKPFVLRHLRLPHDLAGTGQLLIGFCLSGAGYKLYEEADYYRNYQEFLQTPKI